MSLQSQLDINQDNSVAAVSSPVRLAEELALQNISSQIRQGNNK